MRSFKQWRADRDVSAELAVVAAIGMLRPSKASGFPIIRLTGMGPGRTYAAMARLEGRGVLVSEWADGPHPRRRLYRVVSEAAR